MIKINIQNEYSPLKTVILGIAKDIGPPPLEKDVYDPGSLYHIQNNSYPTEKDLLIEPKIYVLHFYLLNYCMIQFYPQFDKAGHENSTF